MARKAKIQPDRVIATMEALLGPTPDPPERDISLAEVQLMMAAERKAADGP